MLRITASNSAPDGPAQELAAVTAAAGVEGALMIRMSMANEYGTEVTKYLLLLNILPECSDSENGMRIENTTNVYSNAARAAKNLETAFIEEMVNHMVPKPVAGEFSGGIGEEQFSSFLNSEYAAALSASLDLGLKVGRDG